MFFLLSHPSPLRATQQYFFPLARLLVSLFLLLPELQNPSFVGAGITPNLKWYFSGFFADKSGHNSGKGDVKWKLLGYLLAHSLCPLPFTLPSSLSINHGEGSAILFSSSTFWSMLLCRTYLPLDLMLREKETKSVIQATVFESLLLEPEWSH